MNRVVQNGYTNNASLSIFEKTLKEHTNQIAAHICFDILSNSGTFKCEIKMDFCEQKVVGNTLSNSGPLFDRL